MSEPETHDTSPDGWDPPSGPPAPRPDPYAQFGNPLHDTWGTSATRAPTGSPPDGPIKVRRKRRWVGRVTAVGIVALLATLGWFTRGTIAEGWDRVYNGAADMWGDGDGDPTSPGSDTTGTTTDDLDERLEAIEAANDQAFGDWMGANSQAVSEAVDAMAQFDAELATLQQSLSAGEPVDLQAHRAALVEFRDASVTAAQVLDAAPQSEIRDGFVTLLLLRVDETNQMITAVDAQDHDAFRASAQRLQRAETESRRLCRQHGRRAGALCG